MICFGTATFTFAQDDYKEGVIAFQKELNEHYKNPEESPLSEKNMASFKGHDFFSINKDYRVVADYKKLEDPNTIFT